MWGSESGRGEPIGWIDGVPIYADGSRGRRMQDPATIPDGGGPAYGGGHDDRRSGAADGPNRGFSVASRQDPAGAPTFESLVQHDNSSGRKAKSSLKLIVPAIAIASLVMSGIFGVVGRAVDGVRDAADDATGTFTSPQDERGPATARGRYSGQVIAVAGRVATVRRGSGTGVDVLFLPDDNPQAERTLRDRAGSWAMITWEERGGQLHVIAVTPFPARAVGTPPPE